MPTKSKKSLVKKNNDKDYTKEISKGNLNAENVFADEQDNKAVIEGIEPISESVEFMNSMEELRKKINSRGKSEYNTGRNGVFGKSFFKSKWVMFLCIFILGFLVSLFFVFM